MNILVIGSGGREHALCWKIKQSPGVKDLYCSPGNGGTALEAVNVDVEVTEHHKVADFCREKGIDLVVVGPEIPLAVGIADDLEAAGISVFGPVYAAARLESSKIFAKELMGRYNVPTAPFRIFDDFKKAEEYIRSEGAPIVVKAYGLAAGKGVIIAADVDEAVRAAEDMLVNKKFGSASQRIIVEECLTGEEASILVMTDGENIIPLASSQDHKRVYDGDKGPNTGGMGAYSPAPVIGDDLFDEILETCVRPTIEGLRNEGIVYRGVLYAGLMITDSGPKVLEYNVRFGDPETQVILPRMKTDLTELLMAAAKGDLSGKMIQWDERECVCVVLASGGYPGSYEKGKQITGIEEATGSGALVFHAGTREENGALVTSGGRVLNIVGMGQGIRDAVANTYRAVEKVRFDEMYYRKDIGYRAIARVET
ncbi:MAG: phosphoribosylamine--glycine ligase [Candidatus Omnitrophota bacterium]|nr:phosphoribosylamine--glycine ligase [Candidatus Omnitrophota bacterium]